MPDPSSHQGLPEEWNHGSHAARGPFSEPPASDGFGNGTAGSHRARTSTGHGTGPTEAYGAGPADPFGARPAGTFGAGAAGTFGAGAADPFGDAASFGTRTADPFGPATTGAFAAAPADAGTARADAERPAAASTDSAPNDAADTRGFLGALFDFGFTSFVTPKVIKVLYMLIVIGTVVSALVVTIIAFKASTVFGLLMLVFGDPLFILIVLAIYRIILEFFVVTFRVAEDVRALRERP